MPRVKRGVTTRQRHKSIRELTKGHRATRHKLVKRAKESMVKALSYSYAHRRERKGDMRQLWITRVSAASRAEGITYGQLINGLKKANITLNRKMLSEIAIADPAGFDAIVEAAKAAIK